MNHHINRCSALLVVFLCLCSITIMAQTEQDKDGGATAADRLAAVRSWFYYLDAGDNRLEVYKNIALSSYDLVVLDPIVTIRGSEAVDMASVIRDLQEAGKIVIAYLDVGQAEDYRTYWQDDWQIGDPFWILGDDPDGWEGNYPVAYWFDEWQSIWFDEATGVLPLVLDLGFDGVYLDWIGGYSDEQVIAFAQQDGVDPMQEMIWFVGDISEYAKARRKDFIVIAQNASELAQNEDYRFAIDAIAQEHVWFDGDADALAGDCPLPATEADVDSDAYYESLSESCRALYNAYPDGTLHTSSAEYLENLIAAQEQGEFIFTVDYALDPANIAQVHETAREYGFIPFVGVRDLDRFIPPYEG